MTKIDCAQNNELEKELTKFLQEQNYSTKQENELLIVNEKLSKSTLEMCRKYQ
ncbi:hypothetical protein [Nitrosopumilus piranensis]|uniref:Uncharacterized protein n=1 Tax=Nitrosopumilus piranensis TaxID=1582439 RepID=A0A0C5BXP8_9ARCH|nr:hypothetical protein [Nitrosopumilus piranensis]AJM93054.1 hypothetical protein NPIRD3C_1844 [Nitrosopumilus piranensis]